MWEFKIRKNNFLESDITGYYHQLYTGYKQPDNPDFLNELKNTFNDQSKYFLVEARQEVSNILIQDIPEIIRRENMSNCICVCVPRAKALETYYESQLMLKEGIKIAISNIKGVVDGTDCITRIKNTLTTHLAKSSLPNDGREPYPGITIDTCRIDKNIIKGNNVILIDDIYTKTVNIDEDCIQALFDNGAKKVIFYAIGYTRRI